jgi:hypothetical protein
MAFPAFWHPTLGRGLLVVDTADEIAVHHDPARPDEHIMTLGGSPFEQGPHRRFRLLADVVHVAGLPPDRAKVTRFAPRGPPWDARACKRCRAAGPRDTAVFLLTPIGRSASGH